MNAESPQDSKLLLLAARPADQSQDAHDAHCPVGVMDSDDWAMHANEC
jgi:hypothetical protein